MFFHNTIKRYTIALLEFFSKLEVQNKDSNGIIRSRNVPIIYSSQEKGHLFASRTEDGLLKGNLNYLPRANLVISTIQNSQERQGNKNVRINKIYRDREIDFAYNSVAYSINYELSILCRGAEEAFMMIEQIAPMFNPDLHLDIYDAEGLEEPSRIKVNLLDIGMETPSYDELSINQYRLDIGLVLYGQIYQPIKTLPRIKEFYSSLNLGEQTVTNYGYDVLDSYIEGAPNVTHGSTARDIYLKDIIFTEKFVDVDVVTQATVPLRYQWECLRGNLEFMNPNSPKTPWKGYGTNIIMCEVSDDYGNFQRIQKTVMI